MPYIGTSPSNGVRRKHTYTATASQTSFSGAGAEGATLSYNDSNFVDVYQNGVKLSEADYTSTTGTTVVLATGATVSDMIEIIVYDVFSVADTVSKADGGTFDGNVTMAGTITVTGNADLNGDLDVDGTTNLDVVDIDGAVDMASTLQVDGAITSSSGMTITRTDNDAQLTLISTDADDSGGPILDLFRNSSSPADGDVLGLIRFKGEDAGGNETTYAQIIGFIQDEAGGAEDGTFKIETLIGGSSQARLNMESTSTVFNEGSLDLDFRVESNGNANMINVDGGNNIVGIGRVPATNDGGAGSLQLEGNDGIAFRRNGQTNSFILRPFGSGDGLRFTQGGTGDVAVIDSSGNFLVGKTNNSHSDAGVGVRNDGQTNIVVAGAAPLIVNRLTDDGALIVFRQDNTQEGVISSSGNTVSYGGFSGSHWSRLSDNSKPTILKGTVIETIDEMCDWYQAEFTIPKTDDKDEYKIKESIALPSGKKVGDTISHTYEGVTYDNAIIIKENDIKHTKCKISDTADSKKVYGVYSSWDNDDDTVNDMNLIALGTYVVRINKDVTVSAGDLLSSNGDGTAKVQDDDIIRSKTIGKVLTNIKQETYSDGSYTVPCALYCG